MKEEKVDNQQEQEKFHALIKKISENSKYGIEDFREHYGKVIISAITLYCKHRDFISEVEDIVLVNIWKKARYIKEIKNPRSWIYVITINAAKSILRKRRFDSLSENIADKKDGIQEFIDMDSFYYMIGCLPEEEQKIMVLRFVSKAPLKEIAEELNCNPNTLCSIYGRALKKIEKFLTKNA